MVEKKKLPEVREREFEQEIIDIARVTRVMAGGKRMRFRACVVIGDKKGRVALGIAKGADVTLAINKAVTKAKKKLIRVPIINETIPHQIRVKFGAAKILLKPAPKGTGVIAGGAVRAVLELAGIDNVVGKILGSKNKINNVQATVEALSQLKKVAVPSDEPRSKREVKKTDEKKKIETKKKEEKKEKKEKKSR